MKLKIKKIYLIIILIVLCGLIINARLLGIFFEHRGGFVFASTYSMFKEHFNEAETTFVSLKPSGTKNSIGIPYIFWIIPLDEAPYDLHIVLCDETEKMKRIVLTMIEIDYGDGSKKVLDHEIIEGFKADYTRTNTGDGRYFDTSVMRLDMKVGSIVKKNQSFNLKLRGYFIGLNGTKIPFETEGKFEYDAPSWDIYWGSRAFE